MSDPIFKVQPAFGSFALIGLMLLESGGLEGAEPGSRNDRLRQEGRRLMEFILSQCDEKDEVAPVHNAAITLEALKMNGSNPDIESLHRVIHDFAAPDRAWGDDAVARKNAVIEKMLKELSNRSVAARPINADEYEALKTRLKLGKPFLATPALLAQMNFAGLNDDSSIRLDYTIRGRNAYARMYMPPVRADAVEAFLKDEMKLSYTRHDHLPGKPGLSMLMIDLAPMTRDRETRRHTTRILETLILNEPKSL